MNKFIQLIITFLLIYSQANYGVDEINSIHPDASKMFFPFLNIGYEARTEAMGGANAGMPNEIYGIMGNPAALGAVNNMQAMISYKPVVLDIKGGTLAFAMPYKATGVWAINIIYLSHGTYSPVDENNSKLDGLLNPYSVAGSISWSKTFLSSLAVGVNLKGIYERLSDGIESEFEKCSADGFAADLGVQYRTRSSRVIYGLLMRNLGFVRSNYTEEQEKSELPISFITGIACDLPSMKLAFDLEKAVNNLLQYKAGLEFNVYKENIFLRVGSSISHSDLRNFIELIKSGTDEDRDYQKTNWSLFSVGGGLKSQFNNIDLNVDTAFSFRIDRLPFAFVLTFLIGF